MVLWQSGVVETCCSNTNTTSARLSELGATPPAKVSGSQTLPSSKMEKKGAAKARSLQHNMSHLKASSQGCTMWKAHQRVFNQWSPKRVPYMSQFQVMVISEMNCCFESGIHEYSPYGHIHVQILHRIVWWYSVDLPDRVLDGFQTVGCVRRCVEIVVPCRFCILLTFLVNWRTGSVCKVFLPRFIIVGQQIPLCSTKSQPQDCRSVITTRKQSLNLMKRATENKNEECTPAQCVNVQKQHGWGKVFIWTSREDRGVLVRITMSLSRSWVAVRGSSAWVYGSSDLRTCKQVFFLPWPFFDDELEPVQSCPNYSIFATNYWKSVALWKYCCLGNALDAILLLPANRCMHGGGNGACSTCCFLLQVVRALQCLRSASVRTCSLLGPLAVRS